MKFLESIRASDAEFTAGRFSELFEGPSADLTRYYSTLAILVLIASGCPEPRQRSLAGATGECLLAARFQADEVFEAELKSRSEVADTFEWCTKPGPFERQLQRQHNNPLFPATMRTISAQQVTEARLSDLRRISDFMNAYRTVEKEVLSPRANMVVKDASDLEKRMIDLIPSCMVLGEFCSKELDFLTKVSDSLDQELARTTADSGLRDAYTRYMALTRIQGYLLSISVAVPAGDGTEDYALRSILSEEFDLISSYTNLCNTTLGTDAVASAQRLVDQAIRDGMDPTLGRRKLEAFRSGWRAFKSRYESGIWADFKRLVRRT